MNYHRYAWLLATSQALLSNIDAVLGHQQGQNAHEDNAGGVQFVINEKKSGELVRIGSHLPIHDGFEGGDSSSKTTSNYKTNESWSHERRNMKGEKGERKLRSKKVSKIRKSTKKDKGTSQECNTNYCEAKPINLGSMKACLKDTFQHLSSVYFHTDGDGYTQARHTANWVNRFPAAIVYAENVKEVKAAMACAVDNGYQISARGGNHSSQGLGTMDGHVVIDMGRTCKPDEFEINKDDQGPHILEGSMYIGTMKGQAGCTNAVMLAMGHKHFKEEGGLTLTGACPSVGITGFVLGGGFGHVSPYVGYGVDIVKEFQILLYNGTTVKASEDENADLYWASRGGGGGNGIITHMTYKVVQAPKQENEKSQGKKFTIFRMGLLLKEDSFEKGAARIQEWFYDADPLITGKFGGALAWKQVPIGELMTTMAYGSFLYLGSWREAIKDLQTTGLFDEELFDIVPPTHENFRVGDAILVENYEVICSTSSPCSEFETPGTFHEQPGAVKVPYIYPVQFDTYAEAQVFNICNTNLFQIYDTSWSRTTGDFCKDLGIDDDKCEDEPKMSSLMGVDVRIPKLCTDKAVIDALLKASGDPSSFINSHGPSPELYAKVPGMTFGEKLKVVAGFGKPSGAGASMLPRFDDKFFAELIKTTNVSLPHLQHGAGLQVHADETAYPWRNAAFLISYDSIDKANDFLGRLLEGGYTPQGYYNYLNPHGMLNWRSYFFGDKWRKLAEIRAKYDPTDVFGKPLTIESIGE